MTVNAIFQIVIYFCVLFFLIKPIGWYLAQVYERKPLVIDRLLKPIEKSIYFLTSVNPEEEMDWKAYLKAMLFFNLAGILLLYLLQRLQIFLPLNPEQFPSLNPALAFNTAVSFVTNTNWQAYAGEKTMSYFSQMLGLTTQNFLSAATGLALLMAFIRGLIRCETTKLGNYWVDLVRGILYILLPMAIVLSLLFVSLGVIQNVKPYEVVKVLQPTVIENGQTITQQILPMGPVASQAAIKQIGSNGGGFFNTNAAHPFENPTPATNFLSLLAILVLPMSLCYTFGLMVKDKRQGWSLFAAMLALLIPLIAVNLFFEQQGNPVFNRMGIDLDPKYDGYPGGNMEGKEIRFGIVNSSLWATVTTATSNGSVNSMLDSFTPIGGLISIWLMHLGEIVFGGVGSGLYNMLMFVIITVFIVGLMVGRSPQYLGKKIEPYEIKMASFAVLIMPMAVLIFAAIAVFIPAGKEAILNAGAHGFSEILYAFTSLVNNNGSTFAGLSANTPFYNLLGGIGMLIGRFWFAIPMLAIAGSLAKKKILPTHAGTLPTHTPFFVILLIGISPILGALSFFPALALGPIAEALYLWGVYGH